ncbi:hypothetical protein bmyco0002_27720 [Bacillus pseudomycoides]|nr:hypothetical protein bmyco0002_27720 [Bacillus pseudomycoides]
MAICHFCLFFFIKQLVRDMMKEISSKIMIGERILWGIYH